MAEDGQNNERRIVVQHVTEALGAVFPLLLQGGQNWDGPPWAGHDGGDFWGPWMLIPFFFWVGLLAFIAWIVTRLFPRRRSDGEEGARRDPAEEILRERFARGEITAEEYLRSLETLHAEAPRDTGNPDDNEDETK